jgi:hypothetical protein
MSGEEERRLRAYRGDPEQVAKLAQVIKDRNKLRDEYKSLVSEFNQKVAEKVAEITPPQPPRDWHASRKGPFVTPQPPEIVAQQKAIFYEISASYTPRIRALGEEVKEIEKQEKEIRDQIAKVNGGKKRRKTRKGSKKSRKSKTRKH